MIRERRYFVLKWKDAHAALTESDLKQLERIGEKIIAHRKEVGKPFFDCVVVESDWPEYEQTWNAIASRVDNQQPT